MLPVELKEKAEEARREGHIALNIGGGPLPLGVLVEFVQDIFPSHNLHQLAITEAEDGEVVISAALGIETKSN